MVQYLYKYCLDFKIICHQNTTEYEIIKIKYISMEFEY